jgi:hypothetical protein
MLQNEMLLTKVSDIWYKELENIIGEFLFKISKKI